MTRTAQRRLERLEKRRPKGEFSHLSDEELERHLNNAYMQLVEMLGDDELRAALARDFPDILRGLDEFQAQGRNLGVKNADDRSGP